MDFFFFSYFPKKKKRRRCWKSADKTRREFTWEEGTRGITTFTTGKDSAGRWRDRGRNVKKEEDGGGEGEDSRHS